MRRRPRRPFKGTEDRHWPAWEFNDIIGYLQVAIDHDGFIRLNVFGIDHADGYKRIPCGPGERRQCTMCPHDYKKYFDKDSIFFEKNGESADLRSDDAELKESLISFLKEISATLEKGGRYINVQYWISIISYLDMQTFINDILNDQKEK